MDQKGTAKKCGNGCVPFYLSVSFSLSLTAQFTRIKSSRTETKLTACFVCLSISSTLNSQSSWSVCMCFTSSSCCYILYTNRQIASTINFLLKIRSYHIQVKYHSDWYHHPLPRPLEREVGTTVHLTLHVSLSDSFQPQSPHIWPYPPLTDETFYCWRQSTQASGGKRVTSFW